MLEKFAPFIKSTLQPVNGQNPDSYRPHSYKFIRKQMDRVIWRKLKKCIKHSYHNSPYYHDLFKKNNLKPSDIKKPADLRKIPYTKTEDLQNNPKSFFAVPEEDFIKVFTTSGSTGKPKKAYFTKKDLDIIVQTAAVGAKLMFGVSKKDVVRLSFEVGYGTELWGNRYVLDRAYSGILGATTIVTGRLSIEEELEIIREYKINMFGDVSSRINYLTKELKRIVDLKTLGVKKFLIGAEPTPNSMRKNIEDSWDADAFIGYGTTELGLLMAGECRYKHGMHLSETNFYTEVVDPKTGEYVNEGEVGELYFTTFDRDGMPLIRYNSHDLGRIIPGRCACGLPLKRIEIKGRNDDLIPIGAGDNLFTKMFDEVIFKIPEIIEYQIQFDKKGGKDLITVTAETSKISDSLKIKLVEAVMKLPEVKNGFECSKTVAKPIVKLVKPNTFKRDSIKFKRLIDNRNLYD